MSEVDDLKAALQKCLPIVKAAYNDYLSAAHIRGSGFNNNAQHMAGEAFGGMWKSKEFDKWLLKVNALLKIE